MKISTIKKLFVEDFSAADRPLVQKLAEILNPFLDQTTKALTNNITATENMKSKVWTLALAAGSTTQKVLWDLNEQPTSVQIDKLTKKDGTAPSSAFSLSWSYASGQIALSFQGLDGSTAYNVRVTGVV